MRGRGGARYRHRIERSDGRFKPARGKTHAATFCARPAARNAALASPRLSATPFHRRGLHALGVAAGAKGVEAKMPRRDSGRAVHQFWLFSAPDTWRARKSRQRVSQGECGPCGITPSVNDPTFARDRASAAASGIFRNGGRSITRRRLSATPAAPTPPGTSHSRRKDDCHDASNQGVAIRGPFRRSTNRAFRVSIHASSFKCEHRF
jgi:hypothetical protein